MQNESVEKDGSGAGGDDKGAYISQGYQSESDVTASLPLGDGDTLMSCWYRNEIPYLWIS